MLSKAVFSRKKLYIFGQKIQSFSSGGKTMSNMFVTIKLIAAAMTGKLNERFGIESQKGVTIIEYALLGALIAAALVTTITTLSTNIGTKLGAIGTSIAG